MTGHVAGTVHWSTRDHVAEIVFGRPGKHNTLTSGMLAALSEAVRDIEAESAVYAVIVSAEPAQSFCAGADIAEFGALHPLGMWSSWTRNGARVFDSIARLRQPTVAAITGDAFGGGLELALACDLRVLADDAVVGMTETRIGTLPGWGGTGRLASVIGLPRAKELVLTGRSVAASTAEQWGLVNRLAPRERVLEVARELADAIAGGAPVAVQMAKQAIDAGGSFAAVEQVAAAATAFTHDGREGIASFREKREARFSGLNEVGEA